MLSSEEIRRFMEEDGIVDGIHVKELPATTELGVAANDTEALESGSEMAAEPDAFSAYLVSHAALSTSAMLHTMQLFSGAALLPVLTPPRSGEALPGDTLSDGPMFQAMHLSSEMAVQSMSVFTQAFAGMFLGSRR